ncbi:MAG: HAD-IIB family hydrolase [Deinococcota bacterium]
MLPLVMLDVDGTILGSSQQLSQAFLDKVAEVRGKGMHLAVCTGRICGGLGLEIAGQLDGEIPHVFHNGAVLTYPDGTVFDAQILPKKTAQQLIEHARAEKLVLEFYTTNQYFVEQDSELSQMHAETLQLEPVIANLEDVLEQETVVRAQWTMYAHEFERASALELEGADLYTANAGHRKDVMFASITKTGVSKGSATKALADHLGINLKRVMGVGDSGGDTPYLDIVGHPRAMANGDESIKAKYPVVPHVDEGGVIKALDQALLL